MTVGEGSLYGSWAWQLGVVSEHSRSSSQGFKVCILDFAIPLPVHSSLHATWWLKRMSLFISLNFLLHCGHLVVNKLSTTSCVCVQIKPHKMSIWSGPTTQSPELHSAFGSSLWCPCSGCGDPLKKLGFSNSNPTGTSPKGVIHGLFLRSYFNRLVLEPLQGLVLKLFQEPPT